MVLLGQTKGKCGEHSDLIDASLGEHFTSSKQDRANIIQNRLFDRSLYVTQALLDALDSMRVQVPSLISGPRLGMILATDRGDQFAMARRVESFKRQMGCSKIAPPDLFRAIAYFPTGRVLKAVADHAEALGPIAPMPRDMDMARQLARIWLASGRADQVLVSVGEMDLDRHGASASMELLGGGKQTVRQLPTLVMSASASIPQQEGSRCTDLALDAIKELGKGFDGKRVALILGSMLGQAGEEMFATISRRDPGSDLVASIHEVAKRYGFTEVFTLIGSSGGAMVGLALAQDLIALNRVDAAVLCGVDLVSGALASALGLLHCNDLPHMQGGAVAILLEPEDARLPRTGRPRINSCMLFSPKIQLHQVYSLNTDREELLRLTQCAPSTVVLSGLNEMDFDAAEKLTRILWSNVPIVSRGETRSVGADVLRLIVRYEHPGVLTGVVSVHALGGTGVFLLSS